MVTSSCVAEKLLLMPGQCCPQCPDFSRCFSPISITILNVLSQQTSSDNKASIDLHQWVTNTQDPYWWWRHNHTVCAMRRQQNRRSSVSQSCRAEHWSLAFKEKEQTRKQEQKAEHTAPGPRRHPNHSRINTHNENTGLILSEELYVRFPRHIEEKQTGAKQKKISCSWKPCGKNRNQRNLTFLFSSGKESDPKLTGTWWHI